MADEAMSEAPGVLWTMANLQTDLRKLLVNHIIDISPKADEGVCPEGEFMFSAVSYKEGGWFPMYAKTDDISVFAISEDGSSILQITKPRKVVVPGVHYPVGDYGEAALQERIVALIVAASHYYALSATTIDIIQLQMRMHKAMSMPVISILADKSVAERLVQDPGITVYVSPLSIGQRVYLLPAPKHLGHISLDVSSGTQGLMVHGKPLKIIVPESPYVAEMASPRPLIQSQVTALPVER